MEGGSDSVSIREVYEMIERIDSKLDMFINETHKRRLKCENRFTILETRQTILFSVFTASIIALISIVIGMVI